MAQYIVTVRWQLEPCVENNRWTA